MRLIVTKQSYDKKLYYHRFYLKILELKQGIIVLETGDRKILTIRL